MKEQTLKRTYKYRLYPTKSQQKVLEEHLALCRWLYNYFLEERRDAYEKNKESISCCDQINELPSLKKENPELNKVYSQTLQDVARRLDKAFQGFFRRVKAFKEGKKKKKPGYPRFKGYWRYDSFVYPQSGFNLEKPMKEKNNKLFLSKIGSIKIKLHRPLKGKVKTLTIRRTNTNKWYACFNVEIKKKVKKKKIKEAIGIDVGLTNFLTTNQGEKVGNPRYLEKSKDKLAKLQRKHSRKKKGSNNRKKSKLRIAKLHEKISNQRKDFLHKLSRRLINNFQLIAYEQLNIKAMSKNKYLSRSINDASWGKLLQYLLYKAEEAGSRVEGVNPKNTSQVCSGCNTKVEKTLSTRTHRCPYCGLTIDRDINAARNILKLALNNTVGTTGINACGVEGLLSTENQEALSS